MLVQTIKIDEVSDNIQCISLKDINLPDDVIENSGEYIPLIGELTGDESEIIVITQTYRCVEKAYVCHITEGRETPQHITTCKFIDDIPGFPRMIIRNEMEFVIKTIDNIKFVMACLQDKEYDKARPNWLY